MDWALKFFAIGANQRGVGYGSPRTDLWDAMRNTREKALPFSRDSVKFDRSQFRVRALRVMRRGRRSGGLQGETLINNVL